MRNKNSATVVSVTAGILSVIIALVALFLDVFPKLLEFLRQANSLGVSQVDISQLFTVLVAVLGGFVLSQPY
jgi:H+/Cl- antiporter ClcA